MRKISFIVLICFLGLDLYARLEGQTVQANTPSNSATTYPEAKFGRAGITPRETEKHRILVHKGEHPSPVPSPGKALVIVGFGSHFGKG